ncbi:hypothetical protein DSECCO2_527910 [anaerobic digester metagenome]
MLRLLFRTWFGRKLQKCLKVGQSFFILSDLDFQHCDIVKVGGEEVRIQSQTFFVVFNGLGVVLFFFVQGADHNVGLDKLRVIQNSALKRA